MVRGTKGASFWIVFGVIVALLLIVGVVAGILVSQKGLFKPTKVAKAEPPPIVKEGIESWKDVLRLTKERKGYEDFLKKITGLNREDVERLARKEERGADLKIPIPKGTVLTNTGKNYKVYPNFKMPRSRVALTDENKEPKVLTWCGNPIKKIEFPTSEVIFFTVSNLERAGGVLPSGFDPLSEENKPGSKFKTEIWALNSATKEVSPVVTGSGGAGYSQHAAHPAVSPNGRYLVFTWIGGGVRGESFIDWLDLSGEEESWPWAGTTEKLIPWWVTFSPDNKLLGFVSEAGTVSTFNLKTGGIEPLMGYKPPEVVNPRFDNLHFSPQGNYLAFETIPLNTDAFLFPIFTLKSDGSDIREVAKMGRSPSWDPKEERLYYLVPAEPEMGKPFDPSLPAYIKSVLPNGKDTKTEISLKASDGLGTALAVGEENFYYVSSTNPKEETLDSIVAFDRKKKVKKVLFKAPSGYFITDMVVVKTPYWEELRKVKKSKPKPAEKKGAKDSYSFEPREGGLEEVMVLEDIRLGDNPAFERVILEFRGQKNNLREGIPRYRARFGNLPYSDSEGNAIPIEGNYYVELVYNGNIADLSQENAPLIYEGSQEFKPGFSLIKEAKFVPAYENNTLILLISLSKKAPFKVSELSNPPRIAIDFKKG